MGMKDEILLRVVGLDMSLISRWYFKLAIIQADATTIAAFTKDYTIPSKNDHSLTASEVNDNRAATGTQRRVNVILNAALVTAHHLASQAQYRFEQTTNLSSNNLTCCKHRRPHGLDRQ